MMAECRWLLLIVSAALPGLQVADAGPSTDSETQPSAPGTVASPSGPPQADGLMRSASQPAADVAVGLSAAVYPPGVTDETQYAHRIQEQVDGLLAAAEAADRSDPAARVEYLLGAANWILARQIEPQVSRLLLGIERSQDAAFVIRSVAEARKHLAAAGPPPDGPAEATVSLEGDEEAAEPAGQGRIPSAVSEESRHQSESIRNDLSAFADALALAWAEGEAENDAQAVRAAASSLAVLLEDDRPGVAPAATLYQAVLYQRAGQSDRAMKVLDLALQPLPPDAASFAFFSRLLRCRYLAQGGGHAVAWSLLLKLEERCQDWFDSPEARQEATCAAVLVRLEVGELWEASLASSGDQERLAWCGRAKQRIQSTLLQPTGEPTATRLGSAVPLLLDVTELIDGTPGATAR